MLLGQEGRSLGWRIRRLRTRAEASCVVERSWKREQKKTEHFLHFWTRTLRLNRIVGRDRFIDEPCYIQTSSSYTVTTWSREKERKGFMFSDFIREKERRGFMFSDFIRISDSEYYEHSCCICICICIYWLLIFFCLLLIKSKSNSFLVIIS
ncbi:unnamed protein product [Brassica oleracea var. botrytis]